MASTSSTYSGKWKFDVFLSFRGEIRNDFLSHLYFALRRNQIKTFIDEKLDKGKDLQVLLQAIEESAISIIIFSKDFASSMWCLDEVVKIVDCMKYMGQLVFPVFLRIDPSIVTDKGETFATVIDQHEKKAKEDMDAETMNKASRWKEALSVASSQCGWDSKVTRPEARLIEEIVREVVVNLEKMSDSDQSNKLIGINSRLQQVSSFLCNDSDNVRIIGIWGMGGIGKTTIAKEVFAKYSKQFEASYFLENVGDQTKKKGLDHLLGEIYSIILETDASSLNLENKLVRNHILHKRILIVLDDVRDLIGLEKLLLGGRDSFSFGSKIIVTSRDLQVIESATDVTYTVEKLNENEALQLLSLYAFKQKEPPFHRLQQSKRVVNYCKSNPLAIRVMGSALFGKDEREWESAVDGLGIDSNPQINDVLRTSYNGLAPEEKQIFLDIACFFRGWNRDVVTEILDGCYSSAYFKTSVLIGKTLINVSDKKLEMHDLLQEMGRNIVMEESNMPGKRSRLWNSEDIYNVLAKSKGTEAIEGIFLDASNIKILPLLSDAFMEIDRLKMLKISQRDTLLGQFFPLSYHLSFLSDELRYLHWVAYPYRSLPLGFNAGNLVVLILPNSNIEQLWRGEQDLPMLKRMYLQGCHYLSALPNLSKAYKLEHIDLQYCESLVELPSYFQHFKKLKYLNLDGCTSLKILPFRLNSEVLEYLNLKECRNVVKCPEISGKVEQFYLSGTAIKEVPSITKLKSLRILKLDNCSNLTKLPSLPPNLEELHSSVAAVKELPRYIHEHKSLKILNLTDYSSRIKLPELPELPHCIKKLIIEGTHIVKVPSSIEYLTKLCHLAIEPCDTLSSLSSSISKLKSLRILRFEYCSKIEEFPQILEPMEGLIHLSIRNCQKFRWLPDSMFHLINLEKLELSRVAIEELPSSIGQLHHLKLLLLEYCNKLITLPDSISNLSSCTDISILHCKKLDTLPELPPALKKLRATGCESIRALSAKSTCNFTYLNFSKCFRLDQNARCWISDNALPQIQLMATKLWMDRGPIELIFPGSEVPKWFSHKSVGSSIAIKFPSESHQIKGIAFCLVVAFKAFYRYKRGEDGEQHWLLTCKCRVKDSERAHNDLVFHWQTMVHLPFAKFDQVVIYYIPDIEELLNGSNKQEIWKNKYSGKKISLEFGDRNLSYTVKNCAVFLP